MGHLDLKNILAAYGSIAHQANDFLPKGTLGYSATADYRAEMMRSFDKHPSESAALRNNKFCLAYLAISVQGKYTDEYVRMIEKDYSNIVLMPITNNKKFGKKFVDANCDALLFSLKSYYFDGYEYLTIFENNDANFTGMRNYFLSNKIQKSQLMENASDKAGEYREIIKEIQDSCVIRPLFTLPTRKVYVRKNLNTPGIGLISIHQYYLGNIS